MSFRSRSSGEEPPSLVLPQTTFSLLSDDLALNCLARVSRLHYPTLSLVSKKFRSLISSPELYKVRSLLGLTESCLYVCFWFYPDSNPRWFTLCRRPDTKKKKKSSVNLLVPIPFPHCTQAFPLGVVAFGSSIYSIGGLVDNAPSSIVSVLDCRSHTWHQAPNMLAARTSRAANVIDEKIYVVGGREDNNSSTWIEVFDPKNQIWNSVSSHGREICGREIIHSTKIDGKICMCGVRRGVAFNPKDGTFEPIEERMCQGWVCCPHCVMDDVLFSYYDKVLKWYDDKARLWRDLNGLEGILRRIGKDSRVKLADYGGKIAVLWDRDVSYSRCGYEVIWCAVIAVERRDNEEEEEIWGRVEWFDEVLRVPKYKFVQVLVTTL